MTHHVHIIASPSLQHSLDAPITVVNQGRSVISVICVLRKLRQEDGVFQVSLCYKANIVFPTSNIHVKSLYNVHAFSSLRIAIQCNSYTSQ